MTTHNLPPQVTPFIGRLKELAEIAQLVADPACRLVSLLGPGGIGKTRLALQAAGEQFANFAEGVYFVALAPVNSPDLLASAIAGTLKLSLYGLEEPSIQMCHYPSNERSHRLVNWQILDACW